MLTALPDVLYSLWKTSTDPMEAFKIVEVTIIGIGNVGKMITVLQPTHLDRSKRKHGDRHSMTSIATSVSSTSTSAHW